MTKKKKRKFNKQSVESHVTITINRTVSINWGIIFIMRLLLVEHKNINKIYLDTRDRKRKRPKKYQNLLNLKRFSSQEAFTFEIV